MCYSKEDIQQTHHQAVPRECILKDCTDLSYIQESDRLLIINEHGVVADGDDSIIGDFGELHEHKLWHFIVGFQDYCFIASYSNPDREKISIYGVRLGDASLSNEATVTNVNREGVAG